MSRAVFGCPSRLSEKVRAMFCAATPGWGPQRARLVVVADLCVHRLIFSGITWLCTHPPLRVERWAMPARRPQTSYAALRPRCARFPIAARQTLVLAPTCAN